VAFSPDGTTLVSGGKTIKRWNVARRRESNSELELEIEEEVAIVSLAFSPDGQTLVALSRDGTVRLWDWTPPLLKLRKKFQVAIGEDPIRQMVISPEGRHLATANADGTVYILRLERYKPSLPK
jgi:WD40 repeat protein